MNKEAVFALRFVTKDLAKMQKGINDINKKLDQLKRTVDKTKKPLDNQKKQINSLEKSFAKAARSALKFALAYMSIQKIFNTAMKNANESLQLHLMADMAGVAADKVNKLGRALLRYSGDAKSAGSAYRSLSDIIGGATHGMGISEDISRINAMYGIGINYGNISEDELMTNIAIAMNRLKQNGDTWGIRQIASAYGLDESMADFLATEGKNWSVKRDTYEVPLTERQAAIESLEKQKEIEDSFNKLINLLLPAIQHTLDFIATGIEHIPGFDGKYEEYKNARKQMLQNLNEKASQKITNLQKSGFSVFQDPERFNKILEKVPNKWGILDPESYGNRKAIISAGEETYKTRDVLDAEYQLNKLLKAQNLDEWFDVLTKMTKFNIDIENADLVEKATAGKRFFGTNQEGNFYIEVGGITIEDTSGTLKGKYNALTEEIKNRVFQNAYENAISSSSLRRTLNPTLIK